MSGLEKPRIMCWPGTAGETGEGRDGRPAFEERTGSVLKNNPRWDEGHNELGLAEPHAHAGAKMKEEQCHPIDPPATTAVGGVYG